MVSFTQYQLHRGNTASDAWGSITTWTVPHGSLRNMKCNLHRVFPFLLFTAVFSLPSSWSYRNGDGLQQAAFHAQGLSEEPPLKWELPPNPNSTHHLIFNSVSGFLQRWPNTLRRNGALDRSLPIHRTLAAWGNLITSTLSISRPQHRARHYPHRYGFVPRTYRKSCPGCTRMVCV